MQPRAVLLATGLLASLPACPAHARTTDKDGAILEEILVTSQRRTQSVQDVPVAVTALSGQGLRLAGVDNLKELAQLAPSLQASSTNSETQGTIVRIRGIGTQSNNPSFESAVGIFVDGVYRSRPGAALSEFLDVERVEVMRGPQGTLFGRNTSAGAISIVTAAPEFEPGGYAEATYGTYDQVDARGAVWGGVTDTLALRLSGVFDRRDGLMTDTTTGRDINTKNRYALKGQALYRTEKVRFRLIADYRAQNEDCCYGVVWAYRGGATAGLINSLSPGAQAVPPRPGDRAAAVTAGQDPVQDARDWGLSGELVWDRGAANLTAITAYRNYESYREQDIDFTGADLLFNVRRDRIETFTQEVRLQGRSGRLDWLVGGYFADETIGIDGNVLYGSHYEPFLNALTGPFVSAFFGESLGVANFSQLASVMSGGAVGPGMGWAEGMGAVGDRYGIEGRSYALFSHNVIALNDRLDLILGLRWTREEKRGYADLNNDPANMAGCLAVLPALKALPNFTLGGLGLVPGDPRRVKDTLASLACLGVASPGFPYDLDWSDNALSGTAGFSYKFVAGGLVYGSYRHGFKAGGVSIDRAGTTLTMTGDIGDPDNFLDPRFPSETVDAYELGFKAMALGGRAQVNMALFYEDLSNFQLNTFTGFSFVPESVEKAVSKGIEVELQARASDRLDLFAGLTYASANYGKHIRDRSNILTNDRGFRDGTSLLPETSILAGHALSNAPRWVLTGGATYRQPLGRGWEVFVHGNARYQSAFETDPDLDPEKLQQGFAIVNGRLGLETLDGRWTVELWVRNLFDKDYGQLIYDIPLQADDGFGAILAEPRTYGVTTRYNF